MENKNKITQQQLMAMNRKSRRHYAKIIGMKIPGSNDDHIRLRNKKKDKRGLLG